MPKSCLFSLISIFLAPTLVSGKTIVVLMDGTWNLPDVQENGEFPQGASTNVAKLRYLLDSHEQEIIYFEGIGTEGGKPVRVADGAFGKSAMEKVEAAYGRVGEHFSDGDELAIFGFSRGATTARLLARRIKEEGLNGSEVTIGFMGLWDTVAALGIPRPELGEFRKRYESTLPKLRIPDNVRQVVHLLAIDEDRALFEPTMVARDATTTAVDEVWFPGGHGDIGGGWKKRSEHERQLSDLTLQYMILKTIEADIPVSFIENWSMHVMPPRSGQGRINRVQGTNISLWLGGRVTRSLVSEISVKPRIHRSVVKKHETDTSYSRNHPVLTGDFSGFEIVD